MLNHPPKNYECPICMSLKGIENDSIYLKQRDYVYKDKLVSAFISSSWIPTCEGHAIVVPNKHFENIYGLSEKYGHRIFDVAKKTAISIKKAYQCDGITIRQNNESAGDQRTFHYHLHIFPRYKNDSFNTNMTQKGVLSELDERIKYVKKLKKYLR